MNEVGRDLDTLREEIKKVTAEIMHLAAKRIFLAKKIGEIKHRRKIPIEDPKVERELKCIVLKECKTHNIDSGFALKLLDLLVDEAKRVQKEPSKVEE